MDNRDIRYYSSLYGGFWSFDVRDFCYMTNQYFPPDSFIEALSRRLTRLVKSYPSTNWYLSSLAAQPLGLTHEELVIANGASELISAISDRFVSRLAVAVPTFDEFVNRAATQGKTVSAYQLTDDFHLDVDDFARHVLESGANAALLINPNNPTGLSTSKADVLRFLDTLRGLDLVIVDESFIDFVDADPHPSIMPHLADYPNAIVLKSLSKAYGIPGLRLGYAASANQSRIAELRSHLPIWGINSLAQFYLETIGEFRQEFIESCAEVRRATRLLHDGLEDVPYLTPYPTHANFVFSRVADGLTSTELTTRLFEQSRILINDCGRKRGLDGKYVRMASRTAEENAQLVEALMDLARPEAASGAASAAGGAQR